MLTGDRCIPSDVPKIRSSRLRWYDSLVAAHPEVDACTQDGRAKLLTIVRAEEKARREAARGKPMDLPPAQPVPDLVDVLDKTPAEPVPERTTAHTEHVVPEVVDEVSPESGIQEADGEDVPYKREADSPQAPPRGPALLPHADIPDTDIRQEDEETTREEVTRMKVASLESSVAGTPISLPNSSLPVSPTQPLPPSPPPSPLPPLPSSLSSSPPPLPSSASTHLLSTPAPITTDGIASMGDSPGEGDAS